MNTYKSQDRPSRFAFNDNAVLAVLLIVCLVQIAACFSAATVAARHPGAAAAALEISSGTAVAHASTKSTTTNSAVVAPAPHSRG